MPKLDIGNSNIENYRGMGETEYEMTLKPVDYEPVQWESVDQLAARLPFSTDWVYENAANGTLPAHKFKGKWMFDPREVDTALREDRESGKGVKLSVVNKKNIEKLTRLRNNRKRGASKGASFRKAKEVL